MEDATDDASPQSKGTQDWVGCAALGASFVFLVRFLLRERDGGEEGLFGEVGVGWFDFGSQLVVAFEADVADRQQFCFSSLFHGGVFTTSHGEEVSGQGEIRDAGFECGEVDVAVDPCRKLPHEAEVAWCDRFLSLFVRVYLSPCFFQ